MQKTILLDLANETVRRYGELPPDFADKMAKRIGRKFSMKVEVQEVSELGFHYKEIYSYAKSIFREYLKPPKDIYADPRDVDGEHFLDRLVQKFPEDDGDILSKISSWVIYYEYLR